MIYITGDTHGNFQRIEKFCENYAIEKEDVLIILGDAGINYYLNKKDEILKMKLDKLPITLFCIHGNHEERVTEINTYEEQEWRGGTVLAEPEHPTILFAKDGEVYDFDGHQTIVIGGAYSVDKLYRLSRGMKWFESEQPDEHIKQAVIRTLEELDWKVDCVLTHTCPLSHQPREVFLSCIDQNDVDNAMEEWLQEIEEKLEYESWYCGHYHTDKVYGKLIFMFEDILEL